MISNVHVFPIRDVGAEPTPNSQNIAFRTHNGGEDEHTLAGLEGEARDFPKHIEHSGYRDEVMQATERSSNVIGTSKYLA